MADEYRKPAPQKYIQVQLGDRVFRIAMPKGLPKFLQPDTEGKVKTVTIDSNPGGIDDSGAGRMRRRNEETQRQLDALESTMNELGQSDTEKAVFPKTYN